MFDESILDINLEEFAINIINLPFRIWILGSNYLLDLVMLEELGLRPLRIRLLIMVRLINSSHVGVCNTEDVEWHTSN